VAIIIASMKKTRERKVIATARQRFLWLVGFTQLDLATLRVGDVFNLKEELRDFLLPIHTSLAPGGLHVWPTVGPMPEEYTVADLQALQAEVREVLLLAIASRGDPALVLEQGYKELKLRVATPHCLPDQGAPGRHIISVQGSVRDLVLLLCAALIGSQNTAELARCSECDKVFLKKTNQVYCSKACANRVAGRAFRERQGTLAREHVIH
jgi:CGNR zinc finger